MNPVEAVRAHLAVRSRRSIAMHFETFQAIENLDAPLQALTKARIEHGVAAREFDALEFRETRFMGRGVDSEKPQRALGEENGRGKPAPGRYRDGLFKFAHRG